MLAIGILSGGFLALAGLVLGYVMGVLRGRQEGAVALAVMIGQQGMTAAKAASAPIVTPQAAEPEIVIPAGQRDC